MSNLTPPPSNIQAQKHTHLKGPCAH